MVEQESMGGCYHTSYIMVLSDQPVMLGKSHHHQQHTHCVAWEPDVSRRHPAEKRQGWEQKSGCLTLFPMCATVLSRPWPSASASLPSVDPLMKVGGKCMIRGTFFLPLAMAISPSFPVHHPLIFFSSVWFSRSVMSDSLWPHGLQHARPPCSSPTPRVYSNSHPLSWWCHPTISSSVFLFSSCLKSFPVSGSFQISQLCVSGGQSIGV